MKHTWITEGEIYGNKSKKPYSFGAEHLGSSYHNGPKCKKCGYEFCKHCFPEGFKSKCGDKSLGSDDSKLDTGFMAMDSAMREMLRRER